jgi:hypothetical protein
VGGTSRRAESAARCVTARPTTESVAAAVKLVTTSAYSDAAAAYQEALDNAISATVVSTIKTQLALCITRSRDRRFLAGTNT